MTSYPCRIHVCSMTYRWLRCHLAAPPSSRLSGSSRCCRVQPCTLCGQWWSPDQMVCCNCYRTTSYPRIHMYDVQMTAMPLGSTTVFTASWFFTLLSAPPCTLCGQRWSPDYNTWWITVTFPEWREMTSHVYDTQMTVMSLLDSTTVFTAFWFFTLLSAPLCTLCGQWWSLEL